MYTSILIPFRTPALVQPTCEREKGRDYDNDDDASSSSRGEVLQCIWHSKGISFQPFSC